MVQQRGPRRRPKREAPGQLSFDLGDAFSPPAPATSPGQGAPKFRVRRATTRTVAWGAGEQQDPVQLIDFTSSRVRQAGYSARTGTVYVRFVDGTPWEYSGVPENVWRQFRRSPSPGRYINRVLNSYDYHRSNFQ